MEHFFFGILPRTGKPHKNLSSALYDIGWLFVYDDRAW